MIKIDLQELAKTYSPILQRSELDPKFNKEQERRLDANGEPLRASDTVLHPAELATELGQDVYAPDVHELFIDLDQATPEDFAWLDLVVATLCVNGLACGISRKTMSKTSGNWHVVVTFSTFRPNPLERLALQAIMGSDRKREMWGFLRALYGDPRPTLFFESPAMGVEVVEDDDGVPF